jgi:hypothetical protein
MRLLTDAYYEHGTHRVFSDEELMRAVPLYGTGTNSLRTLNHDKAALRARRLIVTGVAHPRGGRVRGTRRSGLVEKRQGLWLTAEEHEALRQARQARAARHRFPVGPTSPPSQVSGRSTTAVDDALRLLRLIEEYGDEVPVEIVADCFGIGERRARNWLVQMVDGFDDVHDAFEVRYEQSFDDVDHPADLTEGADEGAALDDPEPVVRAVVLRSDWASRYPFAHTGTALLGLFCYSVQEIDERLGLIDDYRKSSPQPPPLSAALASAEAKLQDWRAELLSTRR